MSAMAARKSARFAVSARTGSAMPRAIWRPAGPANAIHAYGAHGMVHEAQTREQARDDLIDRWDRDRQAAPDRSRIILTHTNDEVRALNEAARERMRAAGDLGEDVRLTVERGARSFAQRGSRHVPAKRTRTWREERHARDHRAGQRAIHVGAHR